MSTSLADQPQTNPGLFDIPGCQFSPVSLVLPEGLTFDHWQRIGRQLQLADLAVQWWIGDWLNFGEHHYEDKYAQAVEEFGRAKQTLINYAFVARNIPAYRRRYEVDYSTHAEVASLKPEDQEKVLAKAAKEHLSRKVVRREADKIKRAGKPKEEDSAFVLTKEGREFVDRYMEELARLAEDVPSGCHSIQMMIYGQGNRAQWQKQRTRCADYKAIVELFSFEEGTVGLERANRSDISAWLEKCSYFMSDTELDERLEAMVENKMLSVESVEDSRQENRRGVMIDLYRIHPDYEVELENAA